MRLVAALLALFCFSLGNVWGATYNLVTDVSTLSDGDVILIVSPGKTVTTKISGVNYTATYGDLAMNTTTSSSHLLGTDVSIVSTSITSTTATEFTLSGNSSAWKIHNGANYLYTTARNQLTTSTEANGLTFTIAIDPSTHQATITTTKDDFCLNNSCNSTGALILKMHGASTNSSTATTYFALYGATVTDAKHEVYIYKKASGGYAVTYNNGGHGTAPSNTTAASVTLAAITGVTGYTCTGWKADKAVTVGGDSKSAGTLLANGSAATLSAATTFTAQWSANQYTVTLNDNGGSGGSGSKTVTYNANTNLTSSVTVPTKSHHDFAGYWTSTDNGATFGTQLVNTDGSWKASVSTYTDASKNWIKADNVTLYAKWTEHGLTNYRTTCTSCVAPDHVDISGDWDRFGGETISLTATPYDDSDDEITTGITGYQWQKLVSSTWTNVTGSNVSGATSANLQISNCTKDNSGKYRCVVSTGATCSTPSATATDGTEGYGVKVYVLESYNGGTTTYNFTRDGNNQRGSVEISLTASTAYTFKIHADTEYYGNDGTVNEDVTNWVGSTSEGNLTVNSGLGGTFTFTMDYSTGGNNSTLGVPELSITYPRKTIYLTPGVWNVDGAKFAIYYFRKVGETTYGNGWTDFIIANDCGSSADIPQWNGVKMDVVRLKNTCTSPNWSDKWAQTNDITVSSNDYVTITGWNESDYTYGTYAVPTYTISYATGSTTYTSGNSISGSKSNETKTCGEDFTLPSSAIFSATGYTQTGWATSDGGSQAYAFSGSYTTNAAQTFYPAWTAKQTTVSFNQNGGSGGQTSSVTATYGSAMPSTPVTCPTKTGYNFGGYYDGSGGTGTKYYNADGTSAKNWDKTDATYTLYAKWTAKQTTVSFNHNGGSGGQTSSVTATYDAAMPTPITCPTKTGHTFGGYYESTGGTGKQYYAANGSSANNWDKTDATWTLYAKWTINSYTLTWALDGGTVTSAGTGAAVDATGSPSSSVEYNSAITVPTVAKTGYTFTGWNTTPASNMPAANTTYTAQWSINSYNAAVQTISYVTIKATPSGGSAIGEGANADVAYNTTITLNHGSVTAGHGIWGGWRVTKADDPSVVVFNGTANNATFDMPAYAVKVTAYLYSDAIAWCDPNVEVTGTVHLTSTKDVPVYATSGAGNMLNIASTDLGSATSMEIGYLNADADDAEVDKASSAFRLYASDASAAIDASSSSVDVSASRTFDTDYSMLYTPTAYNQRNNYKLQLTFKKGDKELKTVTKEIYGRGLPEEFVIAVKKGDLWVALPNNLASTNAQPSIVPQTITVDNTTTPTEAVYVPVTTVYKARNRGTDSHITTIRFTTTGSNYLQVSGTASEYNMWLSTTNSPNVQDWQLKTSDGNAYEVTIPSTSATKKMGIYSNTYMGYHGNPNYSDIYFLPITNTYTDVPATVHEWGEHGAILEADMTNVASATMHVADGSAVAATLTPVNAESLTGGKYVRVYKSDMTVGAVANENKQLYVHWKNAGGDEIGVSQVTIPCVVAADATMSSIADTKKAWAAKSEVHILPGVTLDANASSFAGEGALSVSNLFVYPGATLKVSSGTFNATTLRLRNGWTRAGDKQYNSARVYVASGAALTKTTASMDYDIYEMSEGKHYYPLAVPFTTAVNTIDYADTYLAGFSTYGTHYVIKEYDGANRASSGPDQTNNWDVVAEDGTLTPGKGYIMTGVGLPAYGGCIIRVPLTYNDGWTANGELATYDAVTKNVVPVSAYGGDAATAHQRHKGWNMLGVPFMSCYGAGTDMYSAGTLINGELVVNTDADENMQYQSTTIPYVSVPSHDFAEYVQTDITEAKLLPGWSFFVQVSNSGNLTFAVSNRRPDEDNPIYAPQRTKADEVVRTGIILSDGNKSDKTTLLISDMYSAAEYEINADLEKMFGDGYTLATYSLSGDTRLAYNAISTTDAKGVIPIGFRAPEDGEYTFSLNPRYAGASFERVDLIDYKTGEVTNLMMSNYTFSTERTQDDERFALNVVPMAKVPTGVDGVNADSEHARKIILDDKMYIIYDGRMYDATGKRVTGINK